MWEKSWQLILISSPCFSSKLLWDRCFLQLGWGSNLRSSSSFSSLNRELLLDLALLLVACFSTSYRTIDSSLGMNCRLTFFFFPSISSSSSVSSSEV